MPRRTKEEAEKTRQEILFSALDIFYEKGYSKTTFDEIAKRINLLHQAVLAGEILNAGHWSPFLKPSARRRRAPNMAGTTQISNILVNERQQ